VKNTPKFGKIKNGLGKINHVLCEKAGNNEENGLSAFLTPHPESDTMKKYALTKNSMNAAKNQKPLQLEIGETPSASTGEKPQSAIQLEIAGIVDKYATAVADVQKGTVGEIGKFTRAVALVGSLAATPAGMAVESPYEPVAAREGGVVLVEKERVKLEKEFKPLLEANGRGRFIPMYDSLPATNKDRIAKCYAIFKEKGLDEKRIIAGTSMVVESAFGAQNAKIIIREWTVNKRDANIESYTIAPKIKNAARLAPEILELYNISELEEIDRLQKEVFDAIIANSEQRAAANRQEAAASEQRAARLKEENAKLDAMMKRL
jgi:hypothetical protein